MQANAYFNSRGQMPVYHGVKKIPKPGISTEEVETHTVFLGTQMPTDAVAAEIANGSINLDKLDPQGMAWLMTVLDQIYPWTIPMRNAMTQGVSAQDAANAVNQKFSEIQTEQSLAQSPFAAGSMGPGMTAGFVQAQAASTAQNLTINLYQLKDWYEAASEDVNLLTKNFKVTRDLLFQGIKTLRAEKPANAQKVYLIFKGYSKKRWGLTGITYSTGNHKVHMLKATAKGSLARRLKEEGNYKEALKTAVLEGDSVADTMRSNVSEAKWAIVFIDALDILNYMVDDPHNPTQFKDLLCELAEDSVNAIAANWLAEVAMVAIAATIGVEIPFAAAAIIAYLGALAAAAISNYVLEKLEDDLLPIIEQTFSTLNQKAIAFIGKYDPTFAQAIMDNEQQWNDAIDNMLQDVNNIGNKVSQGINSALTQYGEELQDNPSMIIVN